MIGTAFAFVILPAIGFGLLFGSIYYFIPYMVEYSGVIFIYAFAVIIILEIPVFIYMKFIRKKTERTEEAKKKDGEFTFIASYYPFLAHVFVIMYLLSLVTDPLLKHLPEPIDFIAYPLMFFTAALGYTPILMALYSVYFYWDFIVGAIF